MHGHSPGFSVLVNAEVDSMGGVVDGGFGADTKTSPRRAAIEKVQAELRQEYDVREERRRELEFLEKGGNPLDFKFGLPASISVQSTSLTDQLPEHEAKGSFALATSPRGDSAESSGHPGVRVVKEPNTADNLLFFDGENSTVNGEKNGIQNGKRKGIVPLEQSSNLDVNHNAKESEDSGVLRLGVKRQAYARRNRSKPTRDSAHVNPTNLGTSGHGNQILNLQSPQPNVGDVKVSPWETQVDAHTTACNSKPTKSYENNVIKFFVSEDQLDMELDAVQPREAYLDAEEVPEDREEITASEKLKENDHKESCSQAGNGQIPNGAISMSSDLVVKGEEPMPDGLAQAPSELSKHSESMNGSSNFSKEKKGLENEDQVSKECVIQTGTIFSTSSSLEAEPSCANDNLTITENGTSDQFPSKDPCGRSNGDTKEQKAVSESAPMPNMDGVRENGDSGTDDVHLDDNCRLNSTSVNVSSSLTPVNNEELCDNRTDKQDELKSVSDIETTKVDRGVSSKSEGKFDSSRPCTSDANDKASPFPNHDPSDDLTPEIQNNTEINMKLAKKAHEDAILKEARIIEAKLKRAGQLPMCNFRLEKHRRSHWDYVLEEMAWMANDFMQERLWKLAAAAQICHRISVSGRSKFEKENLCKKQRAVARSLAMAVTEFWHSAEENKSLQEEVPGHPAQIPVRRYAIRFLQCDCSPIKLVLAEAPRTPERITDTGSLEMSWEELSEESLFYKVPSGAMQVYRESMETHWLQYEKMLNNTNQADCEASIGDSASAHETMEEDEGETTMYYIPGAFEGSRASKFPHNKRKALQQKSGASRSHEVGFDSPYAPCPESKLGSQTSSLIGKRPPNALNVGSIPTKRVRTASRQRVVSPFNASATGAMQMTSKTDVSSGDTSSFQDDQSSLQGGSQPRKNSEFESTVDFERRLPFDGTEINKPKKKKPKYMGYKNSLNSTDCGAFVASGKGSSYEQRWPADSLAQLEQKDHLKKRMDSHHFESNGTNGYYMQQTAKKPKISKQLLETSPEAAAPLNGPIPSPVASQMSNMSNSNKLIKVIPGRDRGRKNKGLKVAAGQSGPGSPWTLFEDQALVVLVHDMGPNWELVSDAINSTLQFKCIFRKPKECKERHKSLMDKTAGDGADSAEDSGSSQPYPSTLPGIPKGSARQLFQRLQGPMEEDTLKAHFDKIIILGQKLHSRRIQKDNLDLKQISPVHNSHVLALSQACPNNLSGGPLTPLDLCDTISSSPDGLGLGYQGPPNGTSLPSHQGPVTPILPVSGASTMLQGSPSMVMGNSFPSPSAALNVTNRDTPRYGVPRPSPLPVDDQQRMQQYSQMLSSRNVPGALPVGADRGVRMLPGGSGMGMMGGMSRGVPIPRPPFQGIGSPGVLNMVSSGSVLSSTGVGIPNPVNIHHGSVSGQGNSMMRPRDALQLLRPGQNPEDHRHMIMQELQMQATQGNGQAIAPFNGISAPFSNQTVSSPPVQPFPVQHQQPHQMSQQPHMLGNPHHHIQGTNHTSSQQQAYAMRLKDRLQQRLLHQQQPFSGSNAMSTHQNSNQLQQPSQSSSAMTPISPSHAQHKQQNMPRNPQSSASLPNQMMKQRQRQQIQQQQPRQQPQPQQPGQQQAKLMKGVGRGAMLMHQNVPIDASHVNGPSAASGNQIHEKHTQQGQSLFPGSSGSNSALTQTSNSQKIYQRPSPQSSKQMSPMAHPDNCNSGQIQVPPNQALQQPSIPSSLPLTSQNQPQRQTNQPHQTMHRVMLHQNHQLNSDVAMQSATDTMQVNPIITAQPLPQCTDSVSAVSDVNSASQWKPDASYEASARAPNAHMSNSPQTSLVGTEPLMPSTSQGLAQRQFPGSHPVHGHVIGGPWQQQQQLQPQQLQQQPPPPHQQLHRQAGQGALYGRSSTSGPG